MAFSTALHNPLVYDDAVSITGNSLIRQLNVGWAFLHGGISSSGFANGQFRPLTLFTFTLNYLAGEDGPFGYRVVNLCLHLANGVLGALLLRELLARVPLSRRFPSPSTPVGTAIACFAGAIFIVHPINSLSVLLVWKRATLLFTFFSLIAVHCLLALRRSELLASKRRRVFLHVGMVVAQILALASKENAAILPGLLLLVDLFLPWNGNPRQSWRRVLGRQWPTILVGIVAASFLLSRNPQKGELGPFGYFATQMQVLWEYLAMAVAPHLVDTVYDTTTRSGHDPIAWLAGFALLGVASFAVVVRRRLPFVAFTVLWAAIALSPTSSLIPIPLPKDEDRVYQAFLPLWAFPGFFLQWLASRFPTRAKRIVPILGGALLLCLLGMTLVRATVWSDPEILWGTAVRKHPDSKTAAASYCHVLTDKPERSQQAVAFCQYAFARNPGDTILQFGLATAYAQVGAFQEANALVTKLIKEGAASHLLFRMAGHLAFASNHFEEAIDYYRRALSLEPMNIETAIYLARSYAELGRLDEATLLANQVDRWVLPPGPGPRLARANLYRSIGWKRRACAEYAELSPHIDDFSKTGLDRRGLEEDCRTP